MVGPVVAVTASGKGSFLLSVEPFYHATGGQMVGSGANVMGSEHLNQCYKISSFILPVVSCCDD